MAGRSDEVFIYLKAIGAAQTRRDLEKVAKSLDKLDSETGDHTKTVDENTKAVDENAKAHKGAVKEVKAETSEIAKSEKAHHKLNTTLFQQKRAIDRINAGARAGKKLDQQKIKSIQDQDKVVRRFLASSKKMYDDAYKENERRNVKERASRLRHLNLLYRAEAAGIRKNQILQQRARANELKAIVSHGKAIRKQEAKVAAARNKVFKKLTPNGFPTFNRPGRVLLISSLIFGIADLLPVIGTGLNSLLAGSIAVVNGLAPMVSLLGTIPGILGTFIQFGIVSKFIFGGIGKALAGNQKAMDNLLPSARKLVDTIGDLKDVFSDIRSNIQEAALKGVGQELRNLAEVYFPILNKELVNTGGIFNMVFMSFSKWARSKAGVSVVTNAIKQNNNVLMFGLDALQLFVRAFIKLDGIAGPVLTQMAEDAERFGFWINHMLNAHGDSLSDYFLKAYGTVKATGRVIRNFFLGLYHIFRLSSPLSKELGDNIQHASKHFLAWTKSKKGIKEIKDYFKEMHDPLMAVGHLAEALVKAIWAISNSKNFVPIMDKISNVLVPALVRIITSLDGRFVDLVVNFVDHLSELADAGLINALLDIGNAFVDIVGWLTKLYTGLPDWAKKFTVFAIVIGAIFGNLALGIINGIGGILGAFKAWRSAAAGLAGMKSGGPGAPAAGAAAASGGRGGKSTPRRAATSGGAAPRRASSGPSSAGGGYAPRRAAPEPKSTPRRAAPTPRRSARLGAVGGGAAAVAGMAALPILGSFLGNTDAQLTDVNASAMLAAGNIDRFFQKANGGKLTDSTVQFDNELGAVDGLDSALARITGADWGTKFGDGISSGLYGLIGATSPVDQVKAQFHQLDGQLAAMPAKDAAAKFAQIKHAAEQQHIPMSKLVDLFPEYADKVKAAGGQTGPAADKTQNLANSMASVAGAIKSIDLTKWNKVTDAINKRSIAEFGAGAEQMSAFFAGGTATSGHTAMTGEFGPELTVDRSGRFGMVGLNGPQLFTPGRETAVIPTSATSNPMGGNYGNAPDWARMALQGAVKAEAGIGSLINSKPGRSQSEASQYHVDFSGAQFGSNVSESSVKDAVLAAIREAERDKRERR